MLKCSIQQQKPLENRKSQRKDTFIPIVTRFPL